MSRVNFFSETLHGSGTKAFDARHESFLYEDGNAVGSGGPPNTYVIVTSFTGGATGSAIKVNVADDNVTGVVRLSQTISAAAQTAYCGFGSFTTIRPYVCDPDSILTFVCKVRAVDINIAPAANQYMFFGLSDPTATASVHTNAIGFIVNSSSFLGDRFVASPAVVSGGVLSQNNAIQSMILMTGEKGVGLWRHFMFQIERISGVFNVTYYKLWDSANSTGSAGLWIKTATITAGIPTSAGMAQNFQLATVTSSGAAGGATTLEIDYVMIKNVRKVPR